jgi:predicted transcriptional regulator of viral defense system
MVGEAERRQNVENLENELFHLWKTEYSTDSLSKLMLISNMIEKNVSEVTLRGPEFEKYQPELANIKDNIQNALRNAHFYQGDMNQMTKVDKISAMTTMLEAMKVEDVERYFIQITADVYANQVDRYISGNLRPDIGSVEFQFLVLLNKYHGIVIRKVFRQGGISDYNIKKLVDKYDLAELDNGIYIHPDSPVDREFILVNRYTKSTISHVTALYYHDLTDVIPYKVYVSFPKEYNLSQISKNEKRVRNLLADVIVVNNDEISEKEQVTVLSDNLNPIRITSKERTIADVLKPASRIEEEVKVSALKRYIADPQANVNRLRRIASKQGVGKILDDYLARYLKEG